MAGGNTVMNTSQRTKSMLVLMACVVLCFCCSLNVAAAQEIAPTGPVHFVQCVLYEIDEFLTDLDICTFGHDFNPWCTVEAITDFATTVPKCAWFMFHNDFPGQDVPDPPEDTPDGIDGFCSIDLCEFNSAMHDACVSFMVICFAEANTDIDREQCAGAGILYCTEIF
jgi:hypothetical protein